MTPATDIDSGIRIRTPSGEQSSNRCLNCGRFVTARFARVFGDNADEVHGCIDCLDRSAVRSGVADVTDIDS